MGIQRRISLSIKSASILQNRKRIYEHLFTKCDFSNNFWQDLINSFNMRDIKVEALSEIDKIFGLWKRQADFHLLDHFFILAKHHIYFCRNKGYPPSLKISQSSLNHIKLVACSFSLYQINKILQRYTNTIKLVSFSLPQFFLFIKTSIMYIFYKQYIQYRKPL